MERISRVRAGILLGVFCLVLSLYICRLFNLQIISGNTNT